MEWKFGAQFLIASIINKIIFNHVELRLQFQSFFKGSEVSRSRFSRSEVSRTEFSRDYQCGIVV